MSDVRGIGMDLCEIARIRKAMEHERFLERCFTPEERRYAASRGAMEAESLAAIFAAKEAFVKAVGTGISLPLTEIEVVHQPSGQPCYLLHGQALALADGGKVLLSLTHEAGRAGAFCIWQA